MILNKSILKKLQDDNNKFIILYVFHDIKLKLMKFYNIITSSLVYIDSSKIETTSDSVKYTESLQGKSIPERLLTNGLNDDLGFNLTFEFSTLLLKSYSGVKKPYNFIRPTIFSLGFCISNDTKEFLLKYNIPTHESYRMSCEFRKQEYIYWWFRIHTQPIQHLINIQLSKFSGLGDSETKEGAFDFSKFDATTQKNYSSETMGGIEILYMKKEIEQYDFFFISHHTQHYIVSERLKIAMEKNKFKGMEFIEATWLKIIN
jgi:hypothetical protein